MATLKQLQANQRNALKSTGPRTVKGKEAVRLNAVKHGLLSQQVVLPDENETALAQLRERVYTHLRPVGEMENLLVDLVVTGVWRLRRVLAVEVEIFEEERFLQGLAQGKGLGLAFIRDSNGANAFSKLSRYETAIERGVYRALHELQRLQAACLERKSHVPIPLDVDVPVSGISGQKK